MIQGDTLVYQRAFGRTSVEGTTPVTAGTIFRLASVTKMFTGVTASLLAQRHEIDLDAPIGRYAPDLAPALRRLTLRHLLSHTAGLRDAYVNPHAPSKVSSLAAAARQLDQRAIMAPPGAIYSYSNIGFMLAGYVIERAAGSPYIELVDREVLRPLGMDRSTFELEEAMKYPLALGHGDASSQPESTGVLRPFVNDPGLLPRGGLFSTGPDLARFAIALMKASQAGGDTSSPLTAAFRAAIRGEAQAPADSTGGVAPQGSRTRHSAVSVSG